MMEQKDTYHLIVLNTFQNDRSELMFDGQLVNAVTNTVIPIRMAVDNVFSIQNQIMKNLSIKEPKLTVEIEDLANDNSQPSEKVQKNDESPEDVSDLKKTASDTKLIEDSTVENVKTSIKEEEAAIDEQTNLVSSDTSASYETDKADKAVRTHHKRPGIQDVHKAVKDIPIITEEENSNETMVESVKSSDESIPFDDEPEQHSDDQSAIQDAEEESVPTEVATSSDTISNNDEVSQVVDPFSNVAITADTEVELDERTADAVIADMSLNDADEQRRQFGMVAE